MRASIEEIKRNADGIFSLKVLVPDPDSETLRLGSIELTQKKYEQKRLGCDND